MIELERWADELAQLRPVLINPARCLPLRSPRTACNACASICPEGAIALDRPDRVDPCSACGLCAAVCRADAIVIDNPSDSELVHRFGRIARRSARLELTCLAGPSGPERVGCLGRLTPELLLAAAASGFQRIDLVTGPCDCCRFHAGLGLVRQAVATATRVLDLVSHPCRIQLTDRAGPAPATKQRPSGSLELPVHEERRAFLLGLFGILREALPLPPKRPSDADGPAARPSRRREILRWALDRLGVGRLETVLWGEAGLRLAGACYHCGVCQQLCPNGAITSDGGLRLDPSRCHGCGLCVQVCPVRALALGAPYSLAEIVAGGPTPLGEMSEIHCARCGRAATVTGSGDPLCLPCRLRPEEVIFP